MAGSTLVSRTPRGRLGAWLRVAIGLLGLATLLSFFGDVFWVAEVLTNFRDYYVAALALCLPAALYLRRPGPGLAAGLLLAVNLWFVVPPWLEPPDAGPVSGGVLHLLNLNVYRENPSRERVARYLERSGADAIVVQEIHRTWVRALQRGMPSYVPVLVHPSDESHFGIGLYLRRDGPLRAEHAELFYPDPSRGHPAIAASLRAGDRRLELLAVHLHPPLSKYTAWQRRIQAHNAARWLAARRGPRVLLGDTNMTPYSPVYARLLQESGLIDARRGRGAAFTWFPVPALPFGLPLDTCLHSADLRVLGLERGPAMGSDHRPVHVRLGYAEPGEAAGASPAAYHLRTNPAPERPVGPVQTSGDAADTTVTGRL